MVVKGCSSVMVVNDIMREDDSRSVRCALIAEEHLLIAKSQLKSD